MPDRDEDQRKAAAEEQRKSAAADEQQRKAAEQRRQQQSQQGDKGQQRGGGSGNLTLGQQAGEGNITNEEDQRSLEQQQEDIAQHDERAKKMSDEALDQKLGEHDPEKLGHLLYGGMNLVDTRQTQLQRPMVQIRDPNLAAKRQLAEESRDMPDAGAREEARANRANPNDDTARAEVIARR